ncbi:hypothetical protein CASFOL_031767 [Castilleja foliolosa]|uniref:Uncharacterized protein n=1 Tax=Castilleja foliolosa TaxID=1961234 RepID=A0ABD3C6M9_9LAMI
MFDLAHLYKLIEAAGITYVSIGHRRTLYEARAP